VFRGEIKLPNKATPEPQKKSIGKILINFFGAAGERTVWWLFIMNEVTGGREQG